MGTAWQSICGGALNTLLVGEARVLADQDQDLSRLISSYYEEKRAGRTPKIAAIRDAVITIGQRYIAGDRPKPSQYGPRCSRAGDEYWDSIWRMEMYDLTEDEVDEETLSGFCAVCGAETCDHV